MPLCCRWDKNYSTCYLDDMPHKRLTHPVRVFEWFFDGVRKGHGRENILRLEVSCNHAYRPVHSHNTWLCQIVAPKAGAAIPHRLYEAWHDWIRGHTCPADG